MKVDLNPDMQKETAVNVAERTSPAGIDYWLVEDNTVPLVAMRFGFAGAGAVQDPEGKEGAAYLLSGLLDEGAGEYDATAFQDLLEDNAIRMSFDASHDTLSGELTVLSDTIELGGELLALALNSPRLDDDAIERTRGQIEAGLRRELNDPEAMASRLSSETFFAGHPYARASRGSLESLPGIVRADLSSLLEKTVGQDQLKVSIVGDIKPDAADALVDQAFGALPAIASLQPIGSFVVPTGLVAGKTEDLAQTIIRIALPGIARDSDDYLTAHVMNHILGGGTFSSRMFKEVREKRGLTYSVYTYLASRDHSPYFGGGASTRPERAQETLDVMRSVISELVEDGPTADELQLAKDFLIGSYPLRFDSSQKIAKQLVGMQLEEMPVSYIAERADLISAISVEDVHQIARDLLSKPLSIVTVGAALS
ncbi:MAG: pitrilysin family protein [Pseudomonadota bacterium]